MASLWHLARRAGRALALLAAMMLVLAPALPAHASRHEAHDPAGAGIVQAHLHGKGVAAADQAESGDAGDVAKHAADCCFVCHVSVLPGGLSLPCPVSHPRGLAFPAGGRAPPDIPAERLPEPPRSIA